MGQDCKPRVTAAHYLSECDHELSEQEETRELISKLAIAQKEDRELIKDLAIASLTTQ